MPMIFVARHDHFLNNNSESNFQNEKCELDLVLSEGIKSCIEFSLYKF